MRSSWCLIENLLSTWIHSLESLLWERPNGPVGELAFVSPIVFAKNQDVGLVLVVPPPRTHVASEVEPNDPVVSTAEQSVAVLGRY